MPGGSSRGPRRSVVGNREREVQEKGLVLVFLDVLEGVVGDQVMRIFPTAKVDFFVVAPEMVRGVFVRQAPAVVAEEVVKSPSCRGCSSSPADRGPTCRSGPWRTLPAS